MLGKQSRFYENSRIHFFLNYPYEIGFHFGNSKISSFPSLYYQNSNFFHYVAAANLLHIITFIDCSDMCIYEKMHLKQEHMLTRRRNFITLKTLIFFNQHNKTPKKQLRKQFIIT